MSRFFRTVDGVHIMNRQLFATLALIMTTFGCSTLDQLDADGQQKNASAIASFHDFEWEGIVQSDNCYRPLSDIEQQLLYTVGQLNGHNSVGPP